MKTKLLLIFLPFLLLPLFCNATHILGGYISYTVDPQYSFKYNFRLTVASDDVSQADDPIVEINMGDGNVVRVPKKASIPYGDQSSLEIFEWSHIYLQYGSYIVAWTGINRNPNILNIAGPSDLLTQYIYTSVNISAFKLNRNSVRTALPPKAVAFTGEPFKMNLIAYDADGDNLTYEFVPSFNKDYGSGTVGPIQGYQIPAGLTIDKFGEMHWQSPTAKGEYALSVKITEYREGQVMGYTVVDFQIIVADRTQEPKVTLLNKERLRITPDGAILARANDKLKLEFYVENASATVDQLSARQLSDLDTLDLATPVVTARDSANGKAITLELTAESFLIRDNVYTIGLQGRTVTRPAAPFIVKLGWEFVYIIVEAQQTTASPGSEELNATLVYPNPVQDSFIIDAPAAHDLSWQLYDATGKIVTQSVLKPGKNAVKRSPGLSAGLYTYRISSSNKLIKSGKLMLE
ncbi:T9SS type A sorting domain-containing protein [Pontibacter sp. MBLB2868]|uniref:T9SS type A sorting domain-containing protein n=1 Tax=Pontibacter sp. MBLB2868 TaxID=3451555 RepID=UPI003F7563AA